MGLYEAISVRRSIKAYRQEPIGDGLMNELIDFISSLDPPAEDIDWNFDTLPYIDMVKICSREPWVKAPHYLVLRAERKVFSLQMCGYIGEMAVLFLTSKGAATCWLGDLPVDPAQDFPDTLPFVAAIAFGYSDEPFRTGDGFDRLPPKKLFFGRYEGLENILEAAHRAPSYQNRQPCVFVADDKGAIHIYRRKVFMNNPVITYPQCLDSGVAMAHLETAARALGYPNAKIYRLHNTPIFKHMIYQASIDISKNP